MSNMVGFTGSSKEEIANAKATMDAAAAFDKRYFKARVGANRVRLVKVGDSTGIDIVQRHFITTMEEGQERRKNFACLRVHSKSSCPACERAQYLRQLGDPASMELAKKWDPKPAAFVTLVDRAAEQEGPKMFAMGKMLFDDIMALSDGEDGFELFNPFEGHDLIIKRTGTGQTDTRYTVTVAKTPSPLGTEEQLEEWIHQMPDIRKLAGFMDYESASRMVGGETAQRPRTALPPRGAPAGAAPGPRSSVARPAVTAGTATSRPATSTTVARPAAAPARVQRPSPAPTQVVDEGYGDGEAEVVEGEQE